MHTNFKRVLIVCLFLLPTLVFAADNPAEVQSAAPPQPVKSTPIDTVVKAVPALQVTRIGYVDIVKIGGESERGKSLKVLLTSRKDATQSKIDGQKKKIEKLEKSIKAKIATMTPQQREAKGKEFQKKVEEFQKFARAAEEEFYSLQEKETQTLYIAIEQAAVEYGKGNGFAAVVIKKDLLYVGSDVAAEDITEALIKSLNQGEEKK